jgi:hypothetical protein
MTITDVAVTITATTPTVTRAGFGLPLLIGVGKTVEYTLCNTLADVAATAFTVDDDIYDLASAVFGQNPRPAQIAVVGWKIGAEPTDDFATLTAALTDLVIDSNEWYFLLHTAQTKAAIDELAAWALANKKLYAAATTKTIMDTLAPATDANGRCIVICSEDPDEYPDGAWVGKCAPYMPGEITWKFKTLSGISVGGYTPSEVALIIGAGANTVVSQGGVLHTTPGQVMGGDWIDQVRGLDFLEARIKEEVFSILAASPKVPYTVAGINLVAGAVESALKQAVGTGLVALDADGNPLYSVTVPDINDISAIDKGNRLLPDIKFVATLAGAVHTVQVSGVVEV